MYFSRVFPVIIHGEELSPSPSTLAALASGFQSESEPSSLAGDTIRERQETSKMAVRAARLRWETSRVTRAPTPGYLLLSPGFYCDILY